MATKRPFDDEHAQTIATKAAPTPAPVVPIRLSEIVVISNLAAAHVCDDSGALFLDRASRLAYLPPDIKKTYLARRYLNPLGIGIDCSGISVAKESSGKRLVPLESKYTDYAWAADRVVLADGSEWMLTIGCKMDASTGLLLVVLREDCGLILETKFDRFWQDWPSNYRSVGRCFLVRLDIENPVNTIIAIAYTNADYTTETRRSASVLFCSGNGKPIHTAGPFTCHDITSFLPCGNSCLIYCKDSGMIPVLAHADGTSELLESRVIPSAGYVTAGNYAKLDSRTGMLNYGQQLMSTRYRDRHLKDMHIAGLSAATDYTMLYRRACTTMTVSWMSSDNQQARQQIEIGTALTWPKILCLRDGGFYCLTFEGGIPHINRYEFARAPLLGQ